MNKTPEQHLAEFEAYWKEEKLRKNTTLIGKQNAFELWLAAKEEIRRFAVSVVYEKVYTNSTNSINKLHIVKAISEVHALGVALNIEAKNLKEYKIVMYKVAEVFEDSDEVTLKEIEVTLKEETT